MGNEVGVVETIIDQNGRESFLLFYLYPTAIQDGTLTTVAVTPALSLTPEVQAILIQAEEDALDSGSLSCEENVVIIRRADDQGTEETDQEMFVRVQADYAARMTAFIDFHTARLALTGVRVSI